MERLAQDFPDRPEHRRQLARTLMNLGIVLSDQSARQESEPFLRRAIEVSSAIAAKYPEDVQIRFDLAKTHNNMGDLFAIRGDAKQAADSFQKARSINEALAKAFPDKPRYRESLAGNLDDLALALRSRRPAPGRRDLPDCAGDYDKLVAEHPENVDYRIGQASVHRELRAGACSCRASSGGRGDRIRRPWRRSTSRMGNPRLPSGCESRPACSTTWARCKMKSAVRKPKRHCASAGDV